MKCKFCAHFHTEGQDGGLCTRLGQPIHADWPACSLAAFTSTPALTAIDYAGYEVAHREPQGSPVGSRA